MGSQAATHWDALAHVGYDGKLYNDTPTDVVTPRAARRGSASSTSARWSTRGVLLDIARLHGVDHFDDNYAITGDDLERAASAAGVTVEPGDAVLVRTGQMHFLRAGDKQRYSMPVAGPVDAVDRVAPRSRRRRGRDRHDDVRGLSVRGPEACSCPCT